MSILVTFADGHSTLVVSREAAEQIAAYWPQLHATIRDLDQEARDREEMIGLLYEYGHRRFIEGGCVECGGGTTEHVADCILATLLKRLGRLP